MLPPAVNASDLIALSRPSAPQLRGEDLASARNVAQEFEAMAIGQMFQSMFSELETDGLFGGGAGERAFRPLLVEEYAKNTARAGGIGIADSVLSEIIRLQAGQAPGR
jgi:peptidoglycan hydrolase FlgJ